jgi:hypothetical protein
MFSSTMLDITIGIVFVFALLSVIASTINEIIFSFFNMRGRELLRGLKMLMDDEGGMGLVSGLYNHGQIYGLFKGNFDPKKKGDLPSYIPAESFVMAMLDVVSKDPLHLHGHKPLASLKEGAEKLASDDATKKVGKALVSMIDVAGNDVNKLKKSIEDWYKSGMDRVCGWYKYHTQWALFGIGLVLAITLNADTLRIVGQLSRDSTLRESIVAAAQSAKSAQSNSGQSVKDQIHQVQTEVSSIQDIGIPLGWAGKSWQPSTKSEWIKVFGGWLLTAIAVALGAPFWFDIMGKFMMVRSTLKPQEKSPEGTPRPSSP